MCSTGGKGGSLLRDPIAAPYVSFEAAGRDRGPGAWGAEAEYEIGTLRVAAGKQVTVADSFDNDDSGQAACSEALYVRDLYLENGATLGIQGTKLYYKSLVNAGGTIVLSGCGALVQRTFTVFGQAVTARGFCAGNPDAACMKATGCPSGPCTKCAFEWQEPVDYVYAFGNFSSAADMALYTVAGTGQGTGDRFLEGGTIPSGSGRWYLFRLASPSGTSSGRAPWEPSRGGTRRCPELPPARAGPPRRACGLLAEFLKLPVRFEPEELAGRRHADGGWRIGCSERHRCIETARRVSPLRRPDARRCENQKAGRHLPVEAQALPGVLGRLALFSLEQQRV